MDAVPQTPAHPMPRRRPRLSDDTSSSRFHSRYAHFRCVGVVARCGVSALLVVGCGLIGPS